MVSVSRAMREQTIIANGDLVGCSKDRDELLLILEDYPQLSVIVLSVSLQQACELKGTSYEEIEAILKQISQITIISKDNLNLDELEGFLAQQEYAKTLVRNYDPDKHFGFINEVAYALLKGVNTIVVSNAEDYQLTKDINNLNIWSLKKLKQKYPPRLIKRLSTWIKNNKIWSFLFLLLITFLGVVVIPKIIDIAVFDHYCPLDNTGSFISCGEKFLISDQAQNTTLGGHETDANDSFKASNYEDAVNNFRRVFTFRSYKSPEALIYLNNALLEANKKKANTIAVTVPTSRDQQNVIEGDLAKEILRGVAHVQTLVNECLLPNEFNKFDFLPDSMKNNSLCEEIKAKGKGLRVIIANDANSEDQAEILAPRLNELKDKSILAVIGHNSSDLCNVVIKIYNKSNLVLISFGSTRIGNSNDDFVRDDFFFRTVPDDTFTVKKLMEYLQKNGSTNLKKAAIFYNQDSIFSEGLFKEFKTKFEQKEIGGTIIQEFAGEDNEPTSFAKEKFNALDAIKNSESADILVLFPDGKTTKSFKNAINIIKANAGNKTILGTWTLRSNEILSAVTNEILSTEKKDSKFVTNEKLIVYSPFDSSQTSNQQYVKEGKALWGNADAGSVRTATSYDAAWVLVNAFLQNTNRTKLNDTLKNLGTIENGATGEIIFDQNGNRKDLEGFLLEVVEDKNTDTGLKFVPLSEGNSP